MDTAFDTDYLVVGAGLAGMAFTDRILEHSDATVTIVDRRDAPGGHWRDAYPFVRLHQPSASYGIDGVPFGSERRDTAGHNAGLYELAGPDEIRAHFEQAMQQRLLPSGRVRYLPNCEHLGDGRLASRLHRGQWQVRIGRRLVDAAYVAGEIPAVGPPPFAVADGVRCVPAGALARLDGPAPERYVIIGAGKTALDTCAWLLESGVPPEVITWIRSREAWWLNRRFQQPFELLPDQVVANAEMLAAMARSGSVRELFSALERSGMLLRIDESVAPTMFHGAIVSEAEVALLRTIEDVVRLGRVRAIERDRVVLDGGELPSGPGTLYVHCAAAGLARPPVRLIFEPGRITMQPMFWDTASFQFAMIGVAEATIDGDEARNALCRPLRYWDVELDFLTSFLALMRSSGSRAAHPELAAWARGTRLHPYRDLARWADDPRVAAARALSRASVRAATENLERLVEAERSGASAVPRPNPAAV
ncbi:NAD(P)-binding protein [Microbacterium sp. SD291]|uniref:NAD(P)-binding protein n=1 Tax=Microbacterium sp. SD291 TaxID=2782007 RepID=UPI001A966C40|nr:NAD(P)-binding protein [Microbacterium sp. SD291]MBO0979667.1 NAD(P)-binding protein [Microbacterium sp. SD291]